MTIQQVSATPQGGSRWTVPKLGLVFSFLVAFLMIFGDGAQTSNRIVIINSDDAGMCSSVNKGTISALEFGLLRSTSMMTCCPGFGEFAAYARTHPKYDYGVHLTLTCDLPIAGWGPVLPREQVPSLVGKDGFFHPYNGTVAELADIREVELELRAQIAKAQNEGIRITHLDNHMYVLHSRPDFLELYVKLGIDFGIPIRFPRRLPERYLNPSDATATKHHAKLLEQLKRAGLPVIDRFESANYSIDPEAKRAFFLNDLRTLQPGVLEIVIHCAAPDDSGIEPPDAAARYADGRCFSSREFLEEISRNRITLTDWESLKTSAVGLRSR